MNQSVYCKRLIAGLVNEYQISNNNIYSIEDDLPVAASGLLAEEVSDLIYPSIMFIVDHEAIKYGFPTSRLLYEIDNIVNRFKFPLVTRNEPINLATILPFVKNVCDTTLADETVLSNIFEKAIQYVDPNYQYYGKKNLLILDKTVENTIEN